MFWKQAALSFPVVDDPTGYTGKELTGNPRVKEAYLGG